jgi:hypothetical protein
MAASMQYHHKSGGNCTSTHAPFVREIIKKNGCTVPQRVGAAYICKSRGVAKPHSYALAITAILQTSARTATSTVALIWKLPLRVESSSLRNQCSRGT